MYNSNLYFTDTYVIKGTTDITNADGTITTVPNDKIVIEMNATITTNKQFSLNFIVREQELYESNWDDITAKIQAFFYHALSEANNNGFTIS